MKRKIAAGLSLMTFLLLTFMLPPDSLANYKYISEEIGFSISLPDGWTQSGEIKKGGIMAGVITFADRKKTMSVSVIKMAQFARPSRREVIKDILRDFPDAKFKDINISGIEGVKSGIIGHPSSTNKSMVYLLKAPREAYQIEIVAVSKANAKADFKILENIIASFKIKNGK